MNSIISFINLVAPAAKSVQATWKVPASVCIAQAALETGWGQHVVGNNYFGIKATRDTGISVTSPTMEFIDGKWVTVMAEFCQYANLLQSANEYGRFLKDNPRYIPCFTFVRQPLLFTAALQKAGYATDPNYSEKLNSIITQYRLTQYDL